MAAAFRPVNTSLATDALTDKRMTSVLSAPPSAAISSAPATHRPHLAMSTDEAATAVRSTFNILGPRHLPPTASPVLRAAQVLESAERLRSDSTHRTAKSSNLNSTNVKADESDGDAGGAEETAASEEDSVTADGQRSNKKKKSQRFYCTDYPPCNLSFTRSEHLARHIRSGAPVTRLRSPSAADLTLVGNIRARDRSSATALGASRGWTTCDSMPRRFMSTRTFPSTP